MNKTIYTFWEPKENIPEYLNLCMLTWKKYLPDYEIVVMDYSSLDNILGKDYYDKYLYKGFSLPIQADAIRCAVLKKCGGIWLDIDTIITSEKAKNIFEMNSEFIQFGTGISVISADKNSKILSQWEKYIKKKIQLHKKDRNYLTYILNYKYYRKFKDWSYLGESIIKHLINIDDKSKYLSLKGRNYISSVHFAYGFDNNLLWDIVRLYKYFYFELDDVDYLLNNNCGIVCLQNSWTPEKFKKMSKEQFFNEHNTLSSVLKLIL